MLRQSGGTAIQPEIAPDFVELAPIGRYATETTLPRIPTLVVRRAESILSRIRKTQTDALTVEKAWELVGIGKEIEDDVTTVNADGGVWRIGFCVPIVIQLSK